MKPSRFLLLLATWASPAALFFSGCAKSNDSSSDMDKVKADASAAASSVGATLSDSWSSIKDFTYEKRIEFSSTVDRMSVQLDDQVHALKAKMAGVPDATAPARTAAMKDYDAARDELKARLTELGNATADTWAAAKAKVAEAWQHVQAAYEKLMAKSSS